MLYWDPTYIIILPAVLLSLFAQTKIQSTYAKYRTVYSTRGITGYEAAQRLMSINGINDVHIESISGNLTDHYDPVHKVLRLSNDIYSGTSVASLGVAAHEVGHAIQHHIGYAPLKIRRMLVPIANISSKLSWILLMLGMLFSFQPLVSTGIYLFSAIVLFQLITLPVEIDASRRALMQLEANGIIYTDEKKAIKKVLSAAALTYIASALMSLLQLIRLLMITGRLRRNDDDR